MLWTTIYLITESSYLAKRKGRTKIMKKYLLTDHEDYVYVDMLKYMLKYLDMLIYTELICLC